MSTYELPTCSHCHATQVRHQARFCRVCGAPLPHRSMTQDASWRPGVTSPPRSRWRRNVFLVGAVVALLALTAAGLRTVQDGMSDPTDPVEDLLEQIADGRVHDVFAHLDLEGQLLKDEALTEGYTPPEDLRIIQVVKAEEHSDTQRPNNAVATVHVEYDIGGETHTAHVRVRREETGWLRSWEVFDPRSLLGELAVTSSHIDRVRVAGTEVDTISPQRESTYGDGLPALPGTYTLATAEESLFLSGEPLGEVTVLGSGVIPLTVIDNGATDLTVPEGLVEAVDEQVADHQEGCAEAEILSPPGCPLRVESNIFHTTDHVAWTITLMPEIVLRPAGEFALYGAPLEVETVTPGTAEVEWTYAHVEDEEPRTETVEVVVAGVVTVDEHGEPSWTP